jgi:hypothetical protein
MKDIFTVEQVMFAAGNFCGLERGVKFAAGIVCGFTIWKKKIASASARRPT